jgi:2'-5' RNA ligase
MRLFIGIKISKKFQNKIIRWQKENNLKARLINPQNLHITLVSPWYEEDASKIIERLKKVKFTGFEMVFDKVIINKRNKIVWIETSNPPIQIFELQKSLSEIFKSKNEKREFKPHITIARFKDTGELKKINFIEKVNNVTLFRSKLGRKEANYFVIYSNFC